MIVNDSVDYYINNPSSLDERLEQMYVSNGVKRPIIRTMAVLNDITKTIGKAPKKIFVEMVKIHKKAPAAGRAPPQRCH